MAELFTPERRTEILENLLIFLQTDEQVSGVVMVGSTADDFRDTYSDINLLVIVADSLPVYPVYHKWKTRFTALYNRLSGFEMRQDGECYHFGCLLDNYLGLEMQFLKLEKLVATRKPWKIAFDRAGNLATHLERTYAEEQLAAPVREYKRIMETIWQPILKCVAALRRDEIWRALYLLEDLRDSAVRIAGMNHGVDTYGFTAVDHLPEMFLVHLRHTIPTSTSTPAIRRALKTAVILLFREAVLFEDRMSIASNAHLRKRILEYIEAYA